ncbi:hypothetical protein LCGC14_1774450 [marine sediment metagenome]|uniref:Uncharacterized protein n=1 Tax=marine sediment metagenome TaxID=412755 RepID=A0A0F9JWZ9_9ZZZZ
MTDYIKILENELTTILLKNLEKLRLPAAVDVARLTIKKYFENLKY